MKNNCFLLLAFFSITSFAGAQSTTALKKDLSSGNGTDKNLRITAPLTSKKVRGNINITGTAKAGSQVTITVSSTYYKLGTDQQKKKMFKGEGPIEGPTRMITVRASGQGYWTTNRFNFRNRGWSEEFKIVARSVEGKNATYIIVTDEVKPNIAWD